MSAPITLRPRGPLPADLDVSALTTGLTRAEIERIALTPFAAPADARPAGEWFEVRGDDPSHLLFEGDCGTLSRLGADLRDGRITVAGDIGDELGLGMSGGAIHVQGRAGHFAGARMQGGVIDIAADCGDFPGGAPEGDRQGMAGGLLRVRGNAGDRAGDRMRRGVLVIEGSAGDFLGSRMLAGTVIVNGAAGRHPGYGLKRGTLLLTRAPAQLPPYFNDCGVQEFGFLTLLSAALDGLVAFPAQGNWRRWCGDLAEGGFGEILAPA